MTIALSTDEVEALAEILADPPDLFQFWFRSQPERKEEHPERAGRLATLAVLQDRLRIVIDGCGPNAKDPNACPDCQGSGMTRFHGDTPCDYVEERGFLFAHRVYYCDGGTMVNGEGS